jgi:hypothetical protein
MTEERKGAGEFENGSHAWGRLTHRAEEPPQLRVPDEDTGVAFDLKGHARSPAQEPLDQAEVGPKRELSG